MSGILSLATGGDTVTHSERSVLCDQCTRQDRLKGGFGLRDKEKKADIIRGRSSRAGGVRESVIRQSSDNLFSSTHRPRPPVRQGSDAIGSECYPTNILTAFQADSPLRRSHANSRASVGRCGPAGLVRTSPRWLQRRYLSRVPYPGSPEQGQPFRSRVSLLFLRR